METTNKHFCRNRKCFFFPLLVIGFFSISAVVMLLWNWIIPGISPLLALTYWQAMGLLVLCRILFGGFHFRRHHQAHRHFGPAAFKNKLMDMSAEEKQQFKDQLKKRCCSK